jgi:uncharacterized membrane protein YfcA
LLVAAGLVAGVVGTAGGITSLISYPALLAAGVAPLKADVANLVANVVCLPGAALSSRIELAGTRPQLRVGVPVAVLGAAAGSVLLLTTPATVFDDVVPFLVLLGSIALAAQPRLTRRYATRPRPLLAYGLVGAVSVYGGYFGAGSGVLTLAVWLVLVEPRLPHANAIKNVFVGVGAVASASVYAVAGPVPWRAVGVLAVGLFAGSVIGPRLARRLPPDAIRWSVVLLGLVLAVVLWIRAR